MTPAFSPAPATTPSPAVGSVAQERPRALVRAVLAPHDAEHRELEVVRVAAPSRSRIASSSSSVTPSRRWSGSAAGGRSATVIGAAAGRAAASSTGAVRARPPRCRPASGGSPGRRRSPGSPRRRAPGAASGPRRCRGRSGRRRSPAASRSGSPGRPAPAGLPVASTYRNRTWPSRSSCVERRLVGEVAALAVGDRHPQRPPDRDERA